MEDEEVVAADQAEKMYVRQLCIYHEAQQAFRNELYVYEPSFYHVIDSRTNKVMKAHPLYHYLKPAQERPFAETRRPRPPHPARVVGLQERPPGVVLRPPWQPHRVNNTFMINTARAAAGADETMQRPRRAGDAGEEVEAVHEANQQQKIQARRELHAMRGQMEAKQAELAALRAQTEELSVKVEGRANVYEELEAERVARAEPKKKGSGPSGPACWRQLVASRHHTSPGLAPIVGTGARSSTEEDIVEVVDFQGRSYVRADQIEQLTAFKVKEERAERTKMRQEL